MGEATGGGDVLLRTVSDDGGLVVRVLDGTELVREATDRHETLPTASAALGRTLMGAVLLAAGTKTAETVQVQVRGDGELGQVTAIADGAGHVRGYAHNPAAHPPPKDGKLDVGRAVGGGVLAVVRYDPSWREPYSGIVPLVSGEIAEDLASYLSTSEQTPSAVALGVFVGADGAVRHAGGYLVQALPDASEPALASLDRTVRSLPSPTELLRSGLGADDILQRLLDGIGGRAVHRSEPRFHCGCTPERMRQALVLLGRDELRDIYESGEPLEVRCEFCATTNQLQPDDLGALLSN